MKGYEKMGIFLQLISLIFLVLFINMMVGLFKIRKILRENKDNPNLQGIAVINGEIKIIEKETMYTSAKTDDSIKSDCCGKMVKKSDVYRVVIENKEYYFCSWDCKEKFVTEKKTALQGV